MELKKLKQNNDAKEHSKTVLEGNAFYEIDLDCVRMKKMQKEKRDIYHDKEQRR